MKILFVDNHVGFVDIVSRQFLGAHEVRVAASVQEAVKALEGGNGAAPVDAVLCDFDLDDVDKGDELVAFVRRRWPRLPVVAVSARDKGNEALMAAGADGVCNKVHFAGIAAVLERAVGGARAEVRRPKVRKRVKTMEPAAVSGWKGRGFGVATASPGGRRSQDAVAVRRVGDALVVAVADGVGGQSGGGEAARMAVKLVEERAAVLAQMGAKPELAVRLLGQVDARLAREAGCGLTTAVVAVVQDGRVWGASVGDSRAWLVPGRELTAGQPRRPMYMLGSGLADPVGFEAACEGRLVVASDGLPVAAVGQVSDAGSPSRAAEGLVGLARMASGEVADDVTVVVVDVDC